jgi:hypothetical protein
MAALPEGSLVVKRTFLEFVTSPRAHAGRARFLTDTQLLGRACVVATTESTASVRPAAREASDSPAHAWPKTPMLDALCEPELGRSWPGPLDADIGQQWLLPVPMWPESLEGEQLVYQQPWVWMPLPDLAESCAVQGSFWPCSAAWPSSPALSLASTAAGSEIDSGSDAGGSQERAGERRTTVMLRNVPSAVTRNTLLQVLDKRGLAGCFDMVYVPVDFSTGRGLGYALVNMVSSAAVSAVWQAFDGLAEWGGVVSDEECTVAWSEPNQGLAAHVERYRNSPVMHPATPDEWKPALFMQGVRVEFPAPTKKIKAPKVRGKKAEAA